MLNEPDLLQGVRSWAAEKAPDFGSAGVVLTVTEWPEGTGAVQLELDADTRIAEIMVWADGNAEITFVDVTAGEITPEHRDLRSEADLLDALSVMNTWTGAAAS
ncbi:hypothetical protein [Streptomyces cinnamoneus]|uniref:Uncharacterized protein n=1 Tax=Streptomyces cinnamoneus TaxID=53446 RepID=A0A918TPJ4_STRCJ|nr:hypothetical protein [Streptomyces cinnamoneus]GHC53889.1 hypothetical protein GCM10010507_32730 [Streptomyces cinnamoneus]